MAAVERRLRADVDRLATGIGPRDRAHRDGLERAVHFLSGALADAGITATRQTFDIAGETFENVLARVGRADGPRLVIGAHYDAVEGSPGADDNASGVAALLELARRFVRTPPPLPVDLAFYTLEESAFATDQMGSVRHARSLKEAGVSVRLMLSLEMLGFYSDAPGSQTAPDPRLLAVYGDAGNFLMVVGRPDDASWTERLVRDMRAATDLPVHAINAPREVPGVDLSDHRNFWDAGYPAVMITDTAFYRNPHYHQPTDTPDRLDYGRLAKAVDAIESALRAIRT